MSGIESLAMGEKILTMLVVVSCFALLPVSIIGYLKKQNPKGLIWFSCGMVVFGLFAGSVGWSVRIEQHTDNVIITHFDSSYGWNGENEVHFEVDGEDHWVKIEDGQRDMYELIMGREVILT